MLEKNEERAIGTHFLQFLINHLVLPPKLPQSQEEDLDKGHNVLLDFIYRNAVKFGNLCDKDDQMHWKHIVKMLSVWKETSQSGALSPDVLETNLMSMKPNGKDYLDFYRVLVLTVLQMLSPYMFTLRMQAWSLEKAQTASL